MLCVLHGTPDDLRLFSGAWSRRFADGFHRTEAAQRLTYHTIKARVEKMDAEMAIARALRENLHGLPISLEYRKAMCVRLRKLESTHERIAKETRVVQQQVGRYLQAERVEHELYVSRWAFRIHRLACCMRHHPD